jgi:exonuclease VII small subunit
MSADESLTKAEALLARLEAARARLESADDDDPEQAIEVLQELADLAREIDAELQRARRATEADAADS